MMAKGLSIHIGLNSVDPNHYQGWDGPLTACEADAADMRSIAGQRGFGHSTVLLTKDATRAKVIAALRSAATILSTGDILFLTYSGHGGQLPDKNGDEPDGQDETWCLYDGQIVDDELYTELLALSAGVRVLVLSDSCHSGTVVRAELQGDSLVRSRYAAPGRPRVMPGPIAQRTYQANRAMYDSILNAVDRKAVANMSASVRLISGCQDAQTSSDGTFNGLFTGTLLRVWNGGVFDQNYAKFVKAIRLKMPSDQKPNHMVIGPRDTTYDDQQPFTI